MRQPSPLHSRLARIKEESLRIGKPVQDARMPETLVTKVTPLESPMKGPVESSEWRPFDSKLEGISKLARSRWLRIVTSDYSATTQRVDAKRRFKCRCRPESGRSGETF